MAPRRPGTVDETASTRGKILDAAERAFSIRGFDAATTREIAREADVPLGLMSYHFGTKDDLYTEVIGRRAEQHVADIFAAMAAVKQRAGDHRWRGRPRRDDLRRHLVDHPVDRSR